MSPPSRIIVCCDGTFDDFGDTFERKNPGSRTSRFLRWLLPPSAYHVLWGLRVFHAVKWVEKKLFGSAEFSSFDSNIYRLANAIRPQAADGTRQIVLYVGGIGALGTPQSRFEEAVTGNTMVYKVRYAYRFIVDNYAPGDEIFLFGYSRGAFTARAVVDFIRWTDCILQKRSMCHFDSIWDEYRDISKKFRGDLRSRPQSRNLAQYLDAGNGRQRDDVVYKDFKIRCVGVFDTVASLKAPPLYLNTRNDVQIGQEAQKRHDCFDIRLGAEVENTFQALALDERRFDFYPAVLERPASGTGRFKQCWFPGVHADMGGRTQTKLGLFPLAWMIGNLQAARLLDLDEQFIQHNVIDKLTGPGADEEDDWRPSDQKVTPSHLIDRYPTMSRLIPSWLLPWTRVAHRNPHMAAAASHGEIASTSHANPEQTFHWTAIDRIEKPTGYWEQDTASQTNGLACFALRRPDPAQPDAQITKEHIKQRRDEPEGIDKLLYDHFLPREAARP